MEHRESITDELQKMRDEAHSWRSIAHYWDIPNDWANLRRIYTGGNVGDSIIKRVALAMGFIKPRPPLDAYRPIIKPTSLRTVASGKEIAQLLAWMNENGYTMAQVIEALDDSVDRKSATAIDPYTPYSVYGFNEMEGI